MVAQTDYEIKHLLPRFYLPIALKKMNLIEKMITFKLKQNYFSYLLLYLLIYIMELERKNSSKNDQFYKLLFLMQKSKTDSLS